MQSSRIVPLASPPAGCAVPYSTTRDHCGALRTFSRNISKSALDIAPPLPGFATRRLCLPASPAQNPSSFFWGNVIICAVLAVLSAVPIPHSHSESRTPPLRVRGSSRIRAHRRDLARPQTQLISANDEFEFARANVAEQSVSNSTAQMFLNSIAQRTRAESQMKSALHQE